MTIEQKNHNMVINKTENEYNMKSIRFLLLTITSMFIVIGILMMMLGISVYSYYHNFSYIYDSTKSGSIFTPSVMCVFLGFLLLIISSFGFFGSLKRSTCAVNMYGLILMVMLVMKLVLVILAFTTDPQRIASYIYIPVQDYTKDREIEAEIDSLQTTLNCCGAKSYLDYAGLEFSNHSVVVVTVLEGDGELVNMLIPETCCAFMMEDLTCQDIRRPGCQTALVNIVIQNASVLGVLGVSVMFIELLGIIFALLLARCIRKLKSERAFMAWKIREQLILAREEEQKQLNSIMYITPPESSVA